MNLFLHIMQLTDESETAVTIFFALIYFAEPMVNVYVYVTRLPGMKEAICKCNKVAIVNSHAPNI
jgi:hypothetical protein